MTREDNPYLVRRLVVFGAFAVLVAWAGVWFTRKAVEPPSYSCAVASVPVESGDTLYRIAHEHCAGDVVAVLDILVRMYGTRLDTWQTIHLPIPSGDARGLSSP